MATRMIDRQYALTALASLGVANMGAGNGVEIAVPVNAVVLRVGVYTATAFDSATTATATVGDGTTTFVSAVDVKTTGAETATGVPKYYPTGGVITASLAETGAAATVGEAFLHVEYVVRDRGGEIQA